MIQNTLLFAYIQRLNHRLTIKIKLISALILFLITVLSAFTLYSVRRNAAIIYQKEMETYRFIANTVHSAIRQKFQEAETAVQTVAQNPEIQRLFALPPAGAASWPPGTGLYNAETIGQSVPLPSARFHIVLAGAFPPGIR